MQFAECCLALHALTGDERFATACARWVDVIRAGLPARQGRGGYAEHYGRCIHFLLGYAERFHDEAARALATAVADEAVETLFTLGMFRGHPGEDRYDAVDGVGYLLLALIRLATGSEPDMMGSGW